MSFLVYKCRNPLLPPTYKGFLSFGPDQCVYYYQPGGEIIRFPFSEPEPNEHGGVSMRSDVEHYVLSDRSGLTAWQRSLGYIGCMITVNRVTGYTQFYLLRDCRPWWLGARVRDALERVLPVGVVRDFARPRPRLRHGEVEPEAEDVLR